MGHFKENKYHGNGVSVYPNHTKTTIITNSSNDTDNKETTLDNKSIVANASIADINNKQATTTARKASTTIAVLDTLTPTPPTTIDNNDNSKYEGQYLNGRFHGHGYMKCRDGSEYRGEFKLGRRYVTCCRYIYAFCI